MSAIESLGRNDWKPLETPMLLRVLGTVLLIQPHIVPITSTETISISTSDTSLSQNIYINPNIIRQKPTINPALLKQLQQVREAEQDEPAEDIEALTETDESSEFPEETQGLKTDTTLEEEEEIEEVDDETTDYDSEEEEENDEGPEQDELDEPLNDEMGITVDERREEPQECKGETFGEKLACSLLDSLKDSLTK